MLYFLLMRIIIHNIAWEILSFECKKSLALVLPINIKFNEGLLFYFIFLLSLVVSKNLFKNYVVNLKETILKY